MQSADSSRRSQKRRPDLNINTSGQLPKKSALREAQPSTPNRTPPVAASKVSSKPPVSSRGLRMPSSSPQLKQGVDESLSGGSSPPMDIINRENDQDFARRLTRDSHDLSLPARQVTRDSLVANMLWSLDQFSLGQAGDPLGAFDSEPSHNPGRGEELSRSYTNGSRPARTQNHHYTGSSDLEYTDDTGSRPSAQYSRGRRSNSSSNFQSNLQRISSMRETSTHRGRPDPPRPHHSRGGKTSKSSSSNSIDAGYAQVLGSQKWSHGIGTRSSSFDYGERPSLTSQSAAWNKDLTSTFLVDDYEAAPTPTIPGGPRRPSVPAVPVMPPPPPPPPAEQEKSVDRKRSLRSRSNTGSKSSAPRFSGSREVPPSLPALDLDSAPAPHVGYEKSKEAVHGGPNPVSQPKERPGFFRRMFGSGRANSNGNESGTTNASNPSVETVERPSSKPAQVKSPSTPPSRDSQHSTHPVLQKKTSSFFRRRKKSVSEPPPVPAPPVPPPMSLEVEQTQYIPKPLPSPASSLRQVMSPYLKGSTPATPNQHFVPRTEPASQHNGDRTAEQDPRRVRGFSPDYEPSPNATIRTVQSKGALASPEGVGSPGGQLPYMDSPSRDPPKVPTPKQKDATFYVDTSDHEGATDHDVQPGDVSPTTRAKKHPRENHLLIPNAVKHRASAPQIREQLVDMDDDDLQPETSPSLVLQRHATNDGSSVHRSLELPIDGRNGSRRTSASTLPAEKSPTKPLSVQVDESKLSPKVKGGPLDEPEFLVGEPTEDDRQKAQRIFDGNEDFIQKDRAAAWMGEEGPVRQRTLVAYMELYDFADKSILSALREVCGRLVLRGETQQVDRVLVTFSKRWCTCNSNHGFKSIDVIHTLCYSIMLLNTDLHLADIEQKMTRSQFVKNTMTTIKQALEESAPESFERTASGKNGLLNPSDPEVKVSTEQERPNWRASFLPPRSESALGHYNAKPADACGPLVKSPFEGSIRDWEWQVELVLKEVYISIRDERLPLFGATQAQLQAPQSNNLSVMGVLKRTPSVLSKAPSESQASVRGRIPEAMRPATGRWNSKSRSRARTGNGFASSRTSFEDNNSVWSPAGSSATWSRVSLGRTQTSMSVDSFGSHYPGDYQQSIGFANALSQAIIREDGPFPSNQSVMSEEMFNTKLLEDESLELAGPPWVKEGIVVHKHHLDGVDKKAKDRNWTEVFAVIQKGTLSMFSFSTKSMRQKARLGRKITSPGAVVGGGNWQENATSLGSFSLRQTLASALPPPGYSRTRPHVWALSLPTGAVHLFQVGTPEISKEFVLTVNYWSARLSTHPLVGGISNIEYGWSDAVINNALVTSINETTAALPSRPGSAAANYGRSSMHSRQGSRQSSLRSSFDVGTGSTRVKLPGDRINIADWAPPAQALRASALGEAEQLTTLNTYVRGIEDELQKHNQLRSPMLLAFTPRGTNSNRAMANWERKSSYLLREIVKFRTYTDSLQAAAERRAEIYKERDVAQRVARGEDVELESDDEGDATVVDVAA